jgi:hypothetical protein
MGAKPGCDLNGWQALLDNIPCIEKRSIWHKNSNYKPIEDIILAAPFGMFADTYGRKPIAILNTLAAFLRAG